MTLADLLTASTQRLMAAGIPGDDARAEARLLVQKALGLTREQLILQRDAPHSADALEPLLARRERREPLAYILEGREFYGLTFAVTSAVLIPRPETELLVETTLHHLISPSLAEGVSGRFHQGMFVADIGTGSGCIAIAIAKNCVEANVHATDISGDALAVARENAARHAAAVTFFQGDLLDALPNGRRYHAIVSNPPYIAPGEADTLSPEVRDFEPARALLAPESDGLTFYRRLAADAPARLLPGGLLAVEVGAGQAEAVQALWRRAGLESIIALPDLAGIPRVVTGRKPTGEDESTAVRSSVHADS